MRICNVQPFKLQECNNICSNNKTGSITTNKNIDSNQFVQYSSENIKSKFLPNFCGYRKTGSTYVIDRETGESVKADIRRLNIDNFISIKLMVGREEAGFIDILCDSVFPEQNYVLTQPSNSIPQICHLRSILGDKYSGIGTALIKTAIQESCNNGGFGNLWLRTERGYAKTYSNYRKNENPIPFYYKMGFKSPDPETDQLIKKCIKKSSYSSLPESTLLLLTPEARDAWIKKLVNNPIIKFKNNPITA